MDDQHKFKIIGATVVGFAIVAGAYTLKNFGASRPGAPTLTTEAAVVVSVAPKRDALPVRDTNDDGVEDWREEFFGNDRKPILLDGTGISGNYEVPTTLTGQTGISVLKEIVSMNGLEGFGPTEEEIVTSAADQVREYASDQIIDFRSIEVGEDDSPMAIRDYANSLAQIVIDHGLNETVPEVDSLRALVNGNKTTASADLKIVAEVYKTLLDETMALPVPSSLTKEHLDLINVYQALYEDIKSMAAAGEDPLATFARLKRYQNDAQGLVFSVQNIYRAIEPYAAVFEKNDPALLLVTLDASLRS
jgi:hypothetical protein